MDMKDETNIKEEPIDNVLEQVSMCGQQVSLFGGSQNFDLYVHTGIEVKGEPLDALEQDSNSDEKVLVLKKNLNCIDRKGKMLSDITMKKEEPWEQDFEEND
ncbi:hypothetical protein Anas_13439 [Armadillidium nasatum]|uniref:Uncharacterized protein n=1 Tax=Armadillidium nasatum TaxID=96803 RepID=A0A5N5T0B2_9CRUS|nr:hypothetical protein Anas_13439 [Armadillidium nasatum]